MNIKEKARAYDRLMVSFNVIMKDRYGILDSRDPEENKRRLFYCLIGGLEAADHSGIAAGLIETTKKPIKL